MKIFKKTLAMVLSIIMVFGIMPASVFTASAADASACPVEGATGTGTEEDPIIVDTYQELKAAMWLDDEIFVLVEEGTYIEIPENIKSRDNKKLKVLTVNGTLSGEYSLLRFRSPTIIQGNGKIHCSNSYCIGVGDETTIKGNITFESGSVDGDSAYIIGVSETGTLVIEGGTFISTAGHPTYFCTDDTTAGDIKGKVYFKGGYFAQGIHRSSLAYYLPDGYLYSYDDGTISSRLIDGKPVAIIEGYTLGFESQTPAMPEGETVTHLGDFVAGSTYGKITFSFSAKPMPEHLKKGGLSVTEYMKVVSSKRGVIKEQNSGAAYTIDNTVADSYTITEIITYIDNGEVFDTIKHSFTLTINPQGYVQDPDCPVKGATGTGTEADPIIVDTYEELKAAMWLDDEIFVLVEEGTYIEIPENIKSRDNEKLKVLTVNGTLSGEYSLLRFRSPTIIQGNGKIHCSNSYCIGVGVGEETTIKGNITFESGSVDGDSAYIIGVSETGTLVIEGGTFISTAGHPTYFCTDDTTAGDIKGKVYFKGGYFAQGIHRSSLAYYLPDGYLYGYDDGTISSRLIDGKPVTVFSLGFATQYPAMPEGETAKEMSNRETGKNGILTVKFTAKSLPQASIDAGYKVKEDLKIYDPTGKLIKSQASGASCQIVPEIEGEYRIVETLTLIDPDGNEITSLTHTFTFTAENMYSVSARISGVPEGKPITVNLYKAGEDTPFKTTTAYGQGYFDINSLPVDVAFTITSIPNGDYVVEIVRDNYVPYRRNITVNGKNFVDFFAIESYKTVVVDITGMYDTNYDKDIATVKIYEKGSATVLYTSTVKGNGSHIFAEVPNGKYTVEVSANGYKTKTADLYIYNEDSVKGVYFDMELDPAKIPFGFATQSPNPTAAEIIDGQTDLGLVNTLPTFSFTAKQLYFKYMDMGYSVKTQTQVEYSSGGIKTLDSTTWTCGNYDFGTNKVTQIVMLIDPDGKEVGRKTHTYTFTYAKLFFESRTPGVTNEQAAAGVSELGTLTTAPKFAFTAVSLSGDLRDEGYSQKVKMEAYQGDKLVYSADNGNTYIHIYPGEGKVVQTIILIDPDGNEVGSLAHTYNFTVEFPEGTLALDADFLTLAENSTHQLSATFAPESLADTLVWTSSNSAVATIDSNGKITAVRPGSVLITATLGNGATAYCTVLVTAEDVKAYVGGIGLKEGEYLAQGSNAPTTVKPADNYAYLATVNGKLTLTLHNYSYSGMGTFTSKNAAYGIYSTQELKVVAEGTNKIGPMSAPVDRYTSYGIGKGDSVSISSDVNSVLNITGVSTAISSSRYVFVSGNLNITDVTSGISASHAQAMGGLNFESGNVNINCTGTAISVTGNYINFSGADVTINCKAGINLARQGEITIDSGSLKLYASASGINVKSGQAMTVNGGTVYVEAVNNAVALEGDLYINGGSIVLISTDTASDSSYSAISGAGTLTLASGISSVASTSSNYSTSSVYADSRRSTFDYVSFRGGSNYAFVKQPVGGGIKGSGTMTISWETGFKPTKLELITFNGSSSTVSTLNSYSNYADFGVLPEGGYYQIRAYYATNYFVTSDKFYVYSMGHNVTFDSGVDAQLVADGALAVKPADPEKDNKFFYGWLTPDGKVFDFSTPITEDLVLKAGWADVMVDGVAMPNGTYLGLYSGAITTGRPSDHWARYKDGVLTLYNYNNSYGSGIEFGEIDLTVVSTGEGNAVSCIVSDGEYVNLTIDGTATLNIGHELWTYNAIYIYDTVTFKCDTVIECIDSVVVCDVEGFVVDGADVIIKGYADMAWANGIYGCEAPITVLDGSLYIYCEGGETITDSYITNPDRVTVYANNNLDGVFTDDDIITKVDEAYDLEDYTQIKIVHKHTTVVRYGLSPTCWATGIADHYECVCGKLFSDAEGTEEITDLEAWQAGEGVLPVADHNWDHLNGECAYGCRTAAFEVRHGAVLDRNRRYIFGLDAGILHIGDYTRILIDGYEWTYENGVFDQFGTGSKAILTNGETVIAEYTILIYGDIDGDGWYDGNDAFLVNLIVKGMLNQHDLPEYMWMAADCNHDGVIDETDVDLLMGAGLKKNDIPQENDFAKLSLMSAYVDYAALIDQSAGLSVQPDDDTQDDTTTETTPDTGDGTTDETPATDDFTFAVLVVNVFNIIRKVLNLVFSFIVK